MFEVSCKFHCHHQFLIFALVKSKILQFESNPSKKKTNLGFYLVSYILSKVKLAIFAKYQNKERTSLTGINFL